MSFTTMTVGDLCVSPFNARINEADANAVDGIAQSLLQRGQLMPLVVHPMPTEKGRAPQWGILAGGRRFRAFERLVGSGQLPTDHPIEVVVREGMGEGELVDMSLMENLVRRDLRPYEVFAAVCRAHDQGRSIEEIAETNGQEPATVRRWVRLGELAPEIFAALEAEEISVEQACAFAATADQDLQRWAFGKFGQLAEHHWQRRPSEIRKLLKVGDLEQRKLLRFIGEEAYRDAGGRYELDLFAEAAEERGRITDEGLLHRLVEEKLARARETLRAMTGRDLRFEAAPPAAGTYGGVARELEISWDHLPVPDTVSATDTIAARHVDLPQGDIFATLDIEADGELEVRFWWASRKAMAAAAKKNDAVERSLSAGPVRKIASEQSAPIAGAAALDRQNNWTAQQQADAEIRAGQGLSQEAVQIMRSVRTMALRAALVIDSRSGVGSAGDYLVWSLARDRFTQSRAHERGLRALAWALDGLPAAAEEQADHTPAGAVWREAVRLIEAHPSITDPDDITAFRAYQAEPAVWKDMVTAVVVGYGLFRTCNAGGYRVPMHDELAMQCGYADAPQLRTLIDPTEDMVQLLPRDQRLTLARPYVDDATFRSWGKMKARDLVAPVTRALKRADAFVHPMLRFAPPVLEGKGTVE